MVCFTSDKHPHETLVNKLRKEHRIEIALREKRLRCSPHFYNTESQIDQFLEAMPGH
jgi:selenocysteine lyase/cysteine desulfurase